MPNQTITLTDPLGKGGEATVYNIANQADMVAKLYHQPTSEREAKLRAMLMNPPEQPSGGHVAIAWPTALLYRHGADLKAVLPESALPLTPSQREGELASLPLGGIEGGPGGLFVGFLMPKVTGGRAIFNMYNPRMREQLPYPFDWRALHRTAANLCAVVASIHAKEYVIGDINESNILVNWEALVSIVDCDSFQVTDESGTIHRCHVGKPEYTPPELQGISFKEIDQTTERDLFGLGVLLFQLLMEGVHPFAGVLKSQESVGRVDLYAIRRGLFPYGKTDQMNPPPSAPDFAWLNPQIQQLFKTCFEFGHGNPAMRPSGQDWHAKVRLGENSLVHCLYEEKHLYGQHLTECPHCAKMERIKGPVQEGVASDETQPITVEGTNRGGTDFNGNFYVYKSGSALTASKTPRKMVRKPQKPLTLFGIKKLGIGLLMIMIMMFYPSMLCGNAGLQRIIDIHTVEMSSQTVIGQVTQKNDFAIWNLIHYQFEVIGVDGNRYIYTGTGSANNHNTGDKIEIIYATQNPSRSFQAQTYKPINLYIGGLIFISPMVFMSGAIFVMINYLWNKWIA
ncbi:protein kinase [Anaerolineales bacterium HSG25]|nr:protein kinase [Anaerolineales bacterium HSG25]